MQVPCIKRTATREAMRFNAVKLQVLIALVTVRLLPRSRPAMGCMPSCRHAVHAIEGRAHVRLVKLQS